MLQAHTEIPPDLIRSKQETAMQLGISYRSVDRLVAEGALPVIELSPRRVGFQQSDIDAFKRARRVIRGAHPAA